KERTEQIHSYIQRQHWKSDRNYHYFSNVKRKEFILCLSSADSESAKEAGDMGCNHQQINLSIQQNLGKIGDIIEDSSTPTDEPISTRRPTILLRYLQDIVRHSEYRTTS
ncbi:hypothetical protein AVEN_262020-2-1, partial [Araneus ventricosus]